jgi:hypothetical protein
MDDAAAVAAAAEVSSSADGSDVEGVVLPSSGASGVGSLGSSPGADAAVAAAADASSAAVSGSLVGDELDGATVRSLMQ